MFEVALGHSEDIDACFAAGEIIKQCKEKLNGRQPDAGLLFTAIDLEHQKLLDAILDSWPGLQLIGCTTDGELSSSLGFMEDSAQLMLICSDTADITVGIGKDMSKDLKKACRSATDMAMANTDKKPKLCLAMPDSLTVDGANVISILSEVLGEEIPIVGATAGDQWQFNQTYQFVNGEVVSDALAILFISGQFSYSISTACGWKPVGDPGRVTLAENNVLKEVDGESAIKFYKKYLGEQSNPSGEFPIAVLNNDDEIEYLRATHGIVDKNGAITYVAGIPQDAKIQITISDRDAILDGCKQSVLKAKDNFTSGTNPEVAMFFSCSARKLLLGTRTGEEYKIIRSLLGNDVPLCGFYGYGEIGPSILSHENSRFHNETFVSLLLGS